MSKQNCELTLTHRGDCLKVFKKIEHDQDWENISEVIMEAIIEYNIDIIFNKRLYFLWLVFLNTFYQEILLYFHLLT